MTRETVLVTLFVCVAIIACAAIIANAGPVQPPAGPVGSTGVAIVEITLIGIEASGADRVVVRDSTVRARQTGVVVGDYSRIVRSFVEATGDDGPVEAINIRASTSAVVDDCVVRVSNFGMGVRAGAFSEVRRSHVEVSGGGLGFGIDGRGLPAQVIEGCTVRVGDLAGEGIVTGGRARVVANQVTAHDAIISLGVGTLAESNLIEHTAIGIRVDADVNVLRENVLIAGRSTGALGMRFFGDGSLAVDNVIAFATRAYEVLGTSSRGNVLIGGAIYDQGGFDPVYVGNTRGAFVNTVDDNDILSADESVAGRIFANSTSVSGENDADPNCCQVGACCFSTFNPEGEGCNEVFCDDVTEFTCVVVLDGQWFGPGLTCESVTLDCERVIANPCP